MNFLLALRERRRQRLQDRATVLAQLRDVVADATGDLIVEAIENAEYVAFPRRLDAPDLFDEEACERCGAGIGPDDVAFAPDGVVCRSCGLSTLAAWASEAS